MKQEKHVPFLYRTTGEYYNFTVKQSSMYSSVRLCVITTDYNRNGLFLSEARRIEDALRNVVYLCCV